MKDLIDKFLKNKLNIVLLIIQAIALICLILSSVSIILNILFLLFESVFFVLWGILNLLFIKAIKKRIEEYSLLPYSNEQLVLFIKSDKIQIRNNKFKGVMLICMGVFLLITTFLAII